MWEQPYVYNFSDRQKLFEITPFCKQSYSQIHAFYTLPEDEQKLYITIIFFPTK